MPTLTCRTCANWEAIFAGGAKNEGLCRKLARTMRFQGCPITGANCWCEDWLEKGHYLARDGSVHAERRATVRTPADCPARLQTSSGDWQVQLADLSEGGARLLLNDPPQKGATALLAWRSHEVLCTIAWRNQDTCGVTFEKPISGELVIETTGDHLGSTALAGDMAKIPIGTKRVKRHNG
jgi:hypothetical protein